ncbi:NUDIX hydrolase [Limimaricola cinnabarinus]|uniref:NUDIX hydrolase n=1 Tax=Limimaricola cinnabarinus TaxID=1125964 RepID=A0A2G1MD37_9RHOB|nr:NUDIX hydrolase [Limimaricola cinnabarinus]PHP26646.1 NUDIX hydrolase [Limimaricola cinnabarinus]
MLAKLWMNFIAPLLRRPPRFQVAALCYRESDRGLEVLLVTSLETKRWILPKGWPKKGFDAEGTALDEAWEEAGIRPVGSGRGLIGRYRYTKRLRGNVPVVTDVDVYAFEGAELQSDFPEADRRERRWMTPEEAAEKVDEPQLKTLLRDLPASLRSLERA